MKQKDCKNYLAKVIGVTEDNKNIVKLFRLTLEGREFGYEECEAIDSLEEGIAKKEYSVIGFLR